MKSLVTFVGDIHENGIADFFISFFRLTTVQYRTNIEQYEIVLWRLMKKKREIDMLLDLIMITLIKFAIPMAFGYIFNQLYSIADSVIVGKYLGTNALASVGVITSLANVFSRPLVDLEEEAIKVISLKEAEMMYELHHKFAKELER